MYTRKETDLHFESDEAKSASNFRKHGVSFEEAWTVFLDDQAILIADDEADSSEERFLILGMNTQGRTLVVCHCDRRGDEVIRIISARRASRSERTDYAARWR